MGIAAYVYVVEAGEVGKIARVDVLRALEGVEREDIYIDNDELIGHFSIQRPCLDDRFWNSMAEILKLGNLLLVCSWSSKLLVGDDAVVAHIPRYVIEGMGAPLIVRSGEEIRRATTDAA